MSVSGISGSNLFANSTQNVQSKWQQIQQEFQQLGQDLTSGNISAAQSDFASLQQMMPTANANATSTSTSTSQTSNPLIQDFQQLGQDLQSGNLSAAQQDYSNIQQAMQNGAQAHGHHHHHHGGGGGDSESNSISQLFQQLGQEIQSGNLTSAQQTFTTLQQDFQGTQTNAESTAASGVSVTA